MARSAVAVRASRTALGADLIHANSVRAGLIAAAGAHDRGPPLVVHVRDVLARRALPGPWSGRSCSLGARRTRVHLRARRARLRARHPAAVTVIHNGVDLDRFDPAAHRPAQPPRRRLGLASDDRALGVVAQITPWKGQDDAIAALAAVRRTHPADAAAAHRRGEVRLARYPV